MERRRNPRPTRRSGANLDRGDANCAANDEQTVKETADALTEFRKVDEPDATEHANYMDGTHVPVSRL